MLCQYHFIKKKENLYWYKDKNFWLLFFIINMSGNLSFTYILPYKPILILLFLFLFTLYIVQKKIKYIESIYLLCWLCILLLQSIYTSDAYSFSSSLHFFIKIAVGVFTVYFLRDKFVEYYCKIILFLCLISLLGFIYNSLGGIVPYLPVEQTMLDGGKVFRVSSIIYTQLYNLDSGGITLRNCGPFWEPGAFQGFVNLAVILQLLTVKEENKKWYLQVGIYVISIITTFSTGGYIVLFLNLLYYFYSSKKINVNFKIYAFCLTVCIFISIFYSLDFLASKISNDTGRLSVSIYDLGEGIYMLLGYGLSSDSFSKSSLQSASGLFNLFRYVGIVGFLLYFMPILGKYINMKRLYFLFIIALILMNEPFITAGPFWWCIPLLLFENDIK